MVPDCIARPLGRTGPTRPSTRCARPRIVPGVVGVARDRRKTMNRTKRIAISRTLPALLGALAILALVAGPSLAHPAIAGQSRIYEPAVPWTTQATLADSAADDEKDADELRAADDPTAEDADEQEADQDADDQGA